MGVPFSRAASNTLVPAATSTGRPSMVISTSSGSLLVAVTMPVPRVSSPCPLCRSFSCFLSRFHSRLNSHALRFTRPRRSAKTNSAGTLSFQHVRINLFSKMLQHRLHRRRQNLPEPADRSQTHGLAKLIDQRQIRQV